MKIVLTTKLPFEGFAALHDHTLIFPDESAFTRDELLREIVDCDVLIPTYDYPIDAEIITAAKQLKLIANFGVGFNNIDLKTAKNHEIIVTNTPAPVIDPTAEQTFTLMLACAHRTAELDRKMRQNDTIKIGVMNNLGISICGKTLGIIGMGRIGQAVAQRAVACGMNIIYHNRHKLPDETAKKCRARYVSQDELLRTADFIVLLLPYTPETHHLIDKKAFDSMKKGAVLVNTARGPIVDEQALIENLQNGKLWGAALDVFEHEPHIPDELKRLDNVVMSPHIGTGTIDGRLAMCRCVADNILHFAANDIDKMNVVH
ncbi:MAG: NAD(P)-dependent oxidoreductase [Paludibacteraceae bacterium]